MSQLGNAPSVMAILAVGSAAAFVVCTLTKRKIGLSWICGGAVGVATFAVALASVFSSPAARWEYLIFEETSLFLTGVALALGIVVAVYSTRYMRESAGAGRYYGLLILMVAGVVGVLTAGDALGIYLFFELMSVSSYCLVSFRKEERVPVDAGLRYAVLNASGSVLALLGIALGYLYTGRTALGAVGWGLRPLGMEILGPGALSLGLIVAGLGVKSAVVPFHTWLPDAYSYAPAGISAIMSGIVTETGFIAMLKLVLGEFTGGARLFGNILMAMGAVTMTVGNLGALSQRDLKRLLSYSSIAQVGYVVAGMGLGIGLGVKDGVRGALFHVMTHACMKAAAFLAAGLLIDNLGARDVREMRGAGHRYPLLCWTLAFACLSLAGIPGFAGFMSKWWIYRAGLESRVPAGTFVSVLTILNSLLSLGYYLPLLFTLFARGEHALKGAPSRTPWEIVPVAFLGVSVLVLGIYPVPVLGILDSAAAQMLRLLQGV